MLRLRVISTTSHWRSDERNNDKSGVRRALRRAVVFQCDARFLERLMKRGDKRKTDVKKEQQDPAFRKRTDLPGQNPKANDDPSHSVYNDENRKR